MAGMHLPSIQSRHEEEEEEEDNNFSFLSAGNMSSTIQLVVSKYLDYFTYYWLLMQGRR